MLITVERIKSNDDATLSIVSINGKFECFGLEDEYRDDKVAGETRIPAGIYDVKLRTVGGFHTRYSSKFPWHEGMLHVQNVPDFEYILIHIGNTEKDTAGCLLVGTGAYSGTDLTIQSSTDAYRKLYEKVLSAAKSGDLKIEYIDSDR